MMEKIHNKFKTGSGCFQCMSCKKMTRNTGQDSDEHCKTCEDRMMHENSHVDNNFKNDDCGEKMCLVKHYTQEERWWLP